MKRASTGFGGELREFLRFVARPSLSPRWPGRRAADGWGSDWRPGAGWRRLLAWAGLLWAVNLFALGPVALAAAGAGGATPRIDLHALPVLQAILWAPIVEELLFRYGLRRPAQALWMVPVMAVAVLSGPHGWTAAMTAAALLLCRRLSRQARAPAPAGARPWLRRYSRYFPLVFHLAALAFAAVHLNNYALNQMPLWMMPMLVLPQWVTGLALGWLRVRRGIGASVGLHAIFNAGPMLLVWMIVQLAPEAALQ